MDELCDLRISLITDSTESFDEIVRRAQNDNQFSTEELPWKENSVG